MKTTPSLLAQLTTLAALSAPISSALAQHTDSLNVSKKQIDLSSRIDSAAVFPKKFVYPHNGQVQPAKADTIKTDTLNINPQTVVTPKDSLNQQQKELLKLAEEKDNDLSTPQNPKVTNPPEQTPEQSIQALVIKNLESFYQEQKNNGKELSDTQQKDFKVIVLNDPTYMGLIEKGSLEAAKNRLLLLFSPFVAQCELDAKKASSATPTGKEELEVLAENVNLITENLSEDEKKKMEEYQRLIAEQEAKIAEQKKALEAQVATETDPDKKVDEEGEDDDKTKEELEKLAKEREELQKEKEAIEKKLSENSEATLAEQSKMMMNTFQAMMAWQQNFNKPFQTPAASFDNTAMLMGQMQNMSFEFESRMSLLRMQIMMAGMGNQSVNNFGSSLGPFSPFNNATMFDSLFSVNRYPASNNFLNSSDFMYYNF